MSAPAAGRAPEELLAALGAQDAKAGEAAAGELALWLRRADPVIAEVTAVTALTSLRSLRRFASMLPVAEGALRAGAGSPLLLRLYGQALIEQGLAGAALALFETVRGRAGDQEAEIEGLVGRAHKQHYVESPTGARAGQHLGQAIDAYLKQFLLAPEVNLWHGINTVALLARAERDGRSVAVDEDWKALAARLLRSVEERPAGTLGPWDAAVAAEACVALGDVRGAGTWLGIYTRHPEVDAFALAAQLRQLREVWEVDEGNVTERALVDLLEANLLGSAGGALDVDATVRARELDRDGDYLQGVYGDDLYKTIRWYRAGLEAARSVVRIVRPLGGTTGTGFVLPGAALHPQWEGQSVVVTNFHVANERGEWRGRAPAELRVVFEDNGVEVGIRRVLWESPSCTPGTNPPTSFDTALLLLDTDVLPTPSYHLAPGPPKLKARVYVLGHPLGGELAFSLHDNELIGMNSSLLHYRAPTRVGSSGSPVFDDEWRVVGLHHAGGEELPRLDRPGATYAANEGLLLSAIRDHIRETGA